MSAPEPAKSPRPTGGGDRAGDQAPGGPPGVEPGVQPGVHPGTAPGGAPASAPCDGASRDDEGREDPGDPEPGRNPRTRGSDGDHGHPKDFETEETRATVGARGPSGVPGPAEAERSSGLSGVPEAEGSSGLSGALEAEGSSGLSEVSETERSSGLSGALEAERSSGLSEVPEAQGASKLSGVLEAEGPSGASGGSRTPGRAVRRGVAGAALLIAVLTVFARLAGFGRQLVFSGTVGDTLLGTVYSTVNSVPNIVFEVVAGGALAAVVVPVLAGPVARHARDDAGRIASALLTWVLVVLLPVVLVGAVCAGPIAGLLLRGAAGGEDTGTRMLLVFLPQVPLYGLAVVSGGILQAHRRFLASALAPLISSVVVAASYVLFARLHGVGPQELSDPSRLSRGAELTLSGGTTAGVLALALCTLIPLRSTGLRLRPTLRFPEGVARRVRSLALAGVATLVAQQAATLAVILLANGRGPTGALVVYQNTWMVYLLPYAVLAVPIATAALPGLSAHLHDGDREAFAESVARTTRAVVLAGAAGAALLAATAGPLGGFFAAYMRGGTAAAPMAWALAAFAPGLPGYALVAHLGRSLAASGYGRLAAWCAVAGWSAVIVADVALVYALPSRWTVAALGLGNTVGMTLAGLLLLVATARTAGRRAVHGVPRVVLAGFAAAAAGGAAGYACQALIRPSGIAGTLATAVAAALVGALVFTGTALGAAGADIRAALPGRLTRRPPEGSRTRTAPGGRNPADPADPADRSNLSDRQDPVDPVDPVDQSNLSDRQDPADPVDPVDRSGLSDRQDSAGPVDRSGLSDRQDSVVPAGSGQRGDPVGREDADPADGANLSDRQDPADPADQVDSGQRGIPVGREDVDRVDRTDRADGANLSDRQDSADLVDSADPADQVDSGQRGKPGDRRNPAEPQDQTGQAEQARPADPAEQARPGEQAEQAEQRDPAGPADRMDRSRRRNPPEEPTSDRTTRSG